MSNISQNRSSQENLFQISQDSNTSNKFSFKRLSHSLQYLDRIRSLKFNNRVQQQKLVMPFQKYIQPKQITYIDNQRLYGIVKVQDFEKLKKRIIQFDKTTQDLKFQLHQKNLIILTIQKQFQTLKQKQNIQLNLLQTLKKSISQNEQNRLINKKTLILKDKIILNLIQNINSLQRQLNMIRNQLSNYEINKEKQLCQNKHKMICQSQTQYIIPLINIPQFDPKLQQILKEINSKKNQKINRPTLKQIIQQSLQSFVKGLEEQYKLIKDQSINLQTVKNQNYSLKEENQKFKKIIQQNQIDQEKLTIFKNCLTNFLKDTNQKITQSIESGRIQNKQNLQKLILRKPEGLQNHQNHIQIQRRSLLIQKQKDRQMNLSRNIQIQQQIQINQEFNSLKSEVNFLKEENLRLLNTLGEYQYKWKNIDNLFNDNTQNQQIPDDGTVGQLVKMSKLVKQAVKSLLQQI